MTAAIRPRKGYCPTCHRPDTPWLTVDQVRLELGVSRMTVYRLIDAGDLLAYRIGHGLRVKRSDLSNYLNAAVEAPRVGGARP